MVLSNFHSRVGEKRKRKFQYLQQLIKDGPDDEQESKPSPGQHATYARSLSADYDVAGPSSSPYTLPSNSDFGSMSSSSTPASHPILPATTASFNSSHVHAITHTYPTFPMNWHAHIYSPPPPANWTVPSPWMSGSEYSARVAPRPEMYQHTPSLAQAAFEHTQPPSDEPNDFLSTSDIYGFGSSYPPQGQAPGNPNVSLPASSPYYQGHYPGSC
jgi:hypothetical protein